MSRHKFSLRQLIEAGVHFGHNPRRWNPKMAPFIYGERHKVHIIDLEKTIPMLHTALDAVSSVISKGGRVLFVGTKRQASEIVAETAKKCGQYYVNHRWLGGMLTNWQTISKSISRLKTVTTLLVEEQTGLTKKELLRVTREREKLEKALGGIAEMGGVPNLLIVLDTNKDFIAVHESKNLGIPVVGIVDTNSCPDDITYPVPGNDDASKAIELYCQLFSDAILMGLQAELEASGMDLGAQEKVLDTPSREAKSDPIPDDAKEL